jgi:hypothetical protein
MQECIPSKLWVSSISWEGGCPVAEFVNQALFARGGRYDRPTIWLYDQADHYYSIAHSKKNFAAFEKAGGQGKFFKFDMPGVEGHDVVHDPNLWSGPIGDHLKFTLRRTLKHATAQRARVKPNVVSPWAMRWRDIADGFERGRWSCFRHFQRVDRHKYRWFRSLASDCRHRSPAATGILLRIFTWIFGLRASYSGHGFTRH